MMNPEWRIALAAVLGQTVNCVFQFATFRILPTNGWTRSIVSGLAAGALTTALASIESATDFSSRPVATLACVAGNCLAYLALAYGYWTFLNLGTTSLRIRMLREIESAGGQLPREELLRLYNAAEIVRRRLNRLLANGQVVVRDGRYLILRKAILRIAHLLDFMKWLIVNKRSAAK